MHPTILVAPIARDILVEVAFQMPIQAMSFIARTWVLQRQVGEPRAQGDAQWSHRPQETPNTTSRQPQMDTARGWPASEAAVEVPQARKIRAIAAAAPEVPWEMGQCSQYLTVPCWMKTQG